MSETPKTRHTALAHRLRRVHPRHRGSTLVEFAVVGPLITLLGTTVLQYALMFNAKNIVNHAGFMAAREGSVAHSNINSIEQAYARALIPLYGGGRDTASLQQSFLRAQADVLTNSRIELLNPTQESFDDWADPRLGQHYQGKRVLNHASVQWAGPQVGAASGQDRHDANLIKLRITHGYPLNVPLAGTVMQFMMRWNDNGADPFISELYRNRRVPLVTHVTLAMQSDAIEQERTVSMPGPGNNGRPVDPGNPAPPTQAPPNCLTIGCTVIIKPGGSGGGTGGSGGGSGSGGSSGGGSGDSSGGGDNLWGCPPGDPDCTLLCPSP